MHVFNDHGNCVGETWPAPSYYQPEARTCAYCVVQVPGGWALERVEWVLKKGRVHTRLPGIYPTETEAERCARRGTEAT